MADIFVSYTSSDRDWAFWIAQELETIGHVAHVHEWEVKGGGDITAWMEKRHAEADHILLVVSERYLSQPYSSLERLAAQWAARDERPNFALPVFIEACKPPTLLAAIKRCELYGLAEDDARARLKNFLMPAGKPSVRVPFPIAGRSGAAHPSEQKAVPYPGRLESEDTTHSNIPISVPRHFMGREEILADIATALADHDGRVAIVALHGLRGVGKTTLAAAFAERHRIDYRVTWWIRAQTESTMRADLVGLGVRLGWVSADEKEEPALVAVAERLHHEGEGILLIYDHALDAASLKPYLPRGGRAHVLVTSSAHAWRRIAEPIEPRLWPKEIGADFLIARTGRIAERAAAEALSEALGGLPLAHEQAAAYCERLDISIAEYASSFQTAVTRLMDDTSHAPVEYHDGLTVAKTFALAIEEAAKFRPAAEPLIVHAALLAPEPIPLFLFSEAREKLVEPLPTALADDGLDDAIAALRTFALIDVETIADERDPTIVTDCIRLHRLVRQVAAARRDGAMRDQVRRALIEAAAAVYPGNVWRDPQTWPRARRLDALALALVGGDVVTGGEASAASLLDRAGSYRQSALAAYTQARPLFERALAIREKALGPEHPDTATSLSNLAWLLQTQGDLAGARPLCERALAIREKVLGPEHPDTATSLNNLALLLQDQGDLAAARPLHERDLAVSEKTLGPEHPDTATSLNNLALLLQAQRDLAAARPLFERALAIREKVFGPGHPETATSLNNLASLLQDQDDLGAAQPLYQRALAIREKVLGPEHPDTSAARYNFATLLLATGSASKALALGEAALAAHDDTLGREHDWTKDSARVTADALDALGRADEAKALREKYGIRDESQ